MLIPLLLLTSDNTPQDPVGAAAREYSWHQINRLKNNPHELLPLLQSMTHVAWSIPADSLPHWTARLRLMPVHFFFTNNVVVHREFVDSGVLMLTECTLLQPVVMAMGHVQNIRSVLSLFFYVRANAQAGTYEVLVIPPNGPEPAAAASKFGPDFFQMLSQVDVNAANRTVPVVEEKKSWWKRIF